MRTYRLYELNDEEFEALIIQICMRLLGMGIFSFAVGTDGGRDGRFEGTAQKYPSTTSPYDGKFVIQAKHTRNASASCSQSDFKRIVDNELPRIRRLVKSAEVEHYLLFTNRRLTGPKDEKVRKELAKIKRLKSANLIGNETIDSYLVAEPKIWSDLGFDRYDAPFRINPADLVAVIHRFSDAVGQISKPDGSATNFTYVGKKRKNQINKLTDGYFEFLKQQSLPHFDRIKKFLEDPRNESLRAMYHDTADELKQKTITFRNRFDTFDEVLTYLYDEIVGASTGKHGQRRLVTVFLHYMYFDCDLGSHA